MREHGIVDARRGQQYSGIEGEDVVGLPGVHIEVKRVEQLRLHKAIAQSVQDAKDDEIPIVAHRRNRSEWLVVLRADDFIKLWNQAHGQMDAE